VTLTVRDINDHRLPVCRKAAVTVAVLHVWPHLSLVYAFFFYRGMHFSSISLKLWFQNSTSFVELTCT